MHVASWSPGLRTLPLAGLWSCQRGCDPYKSISLVGVLVAGQGCARLPPCPGVGFRQKRDLPPATGWLLSPQATDCQTHRATWGRGTFPPLGVSD